MRSIFTLLLVIFTCSSLTGQDCIPPPPVPECTPPSIFDETIVIPAGTTENWTDVINATPDNMTTTVKVSGGGTLFVENSNIALESGGAVLYLDSVTFIVNNGNLQVNAAGARFLMRGGTLQTSGNIQQRPNTIECITGTTIEVGDEQADGQFNTMGQNSTSANWQNDGGYRYLESNCVNVTHDFQNQSTGSGSGLNGVDVIINSCFEIGDRGLNHATPTAFGVSDGDDSGNWQNDNTQSIYGTDIVVANGDYQNSIGTMTLCEVDIKLNKTGNLQNNSGTVQGEEVCVAVEDIFENSGTWTATLTSWYSDKQNNTNAPTAGEEATEADILASCFNNGCCDNLSPDLVIEKLVDTAMVPLNDTVTFTLIVRNLGVQATGVTVTDVLPMGLAYVSDDSNGAYDSGTGIWLVDTLGSRASDTLRIAANATMEGILTNQATVHSNETETDTTNNQDQVCISVPIQICDDGSQSIDATAFDVNGDGTTVYQWYVSADNGVNYTPIDAADGGTAQTYNITQAGYYTYTVNGAALGDCGDQLCCPIIVETTTCVVCPPKNCIPIQIEKVN